MKAYLLLLKLNLRTLVANAFGDSIRKENGKLDLSKISIYIIAAIGILVLAGGVIFMEYALYGVMAAIGQQKLLIGMAILLSMIMTVMFSLFHTLASMYFSKDMPSLAHLPIPSRTIMAAKWTEIYVPEAFLSAAILLPLFVLHGIRSGAGIAYYLTSTLISLTAPLYPLAISLLISSVLGRFTSLMKHREVWVVLGTIVMLAVVLVAETMLLPSIPDDADATFFLRLIMSKESLLNLMIGAFPPVMWAVKSIGGDAGMFLLFTAVAAAVTMLLIWLIGRDYLHVVLRHTEHAAAKKRPSNRRQRVEYRQRSPLMAVFHREMNEALKVPVYMLNGVMGAAMMPLIMVVMYIVLKADEETAAFLEALQQLVASISGLDLILICTAALSLMCWITPLIGTAVSREGKRLQVTRMIPVQAETILHGKLLVHLVINFVSSVVVAICLAAVLGMVYLPHVVAGVALANLVSYATGAANLTIDVIRPVLEWKNENEVIKQNMNQILGTLVSTIMLTLLVVPPVLLAVYGANPLLRMLSVLAVLALECGLAVFLLKKVAAPRYAAIEP